MSDLLMHVTSFVSGLAIFGWAFWRINHLPGRGEWDLKAVMLWIVASDTAWVLDQLRGNLQSWDGASLAASVATYLWWSVWRATRGDRRISTRSFE